MMKKRQDIELFRIISAFSIVWYHSNVIGHEIAYGGLIIFLIISMYLAGCSSYVAERPFLPRIKRWLTPWGIWFIVYGLVNIISHNPIIPLNNGFTSGVLAGPSIHLWYMPFVLACLLMFDIIRRYFIASHIAWGAGLLSILILGSTSIWRDTSIQLGYPIAQYAQALAAVVLGIFFAYARNISKQLQITLLLFIIATAIYVIPYKGIGIPYLIGIFVGCILAFRILKIPSSLNFNIIAKNTLGIYFIHILILKTLVHSNTIHGIYLPVTTFFLSLLIIILLRRTFPKIAKYST
ncbi:acyltransferase family protein [Sulfuriferula thiophila]|uniref:acyltransferase family protein n=1 Tax=Sulfuriferula thiophila TaxID=1781211 RepID=UPI000F60C023|nr:acyltransferase family protein [Sulfuriferula thiophila]